VRREVGKEMRIVLVEGLIGKNEGLRLNLGSWLWVLVGVGVY
jgi:hypothetical protein